MKFKIYGPFSLNADACEKGYPPWIDQPKIEEFWGNVRSRHGELDQACGVYIFTVEGKQRKNNKKTSVPWYVGKAERQTFQKECFNYRNQLSYNKIVTVDYKEVDCINLYLLARHEDGNKFSEPAKKDGGEVYEGVRFVEQLFMQKALAANSLLLNIQDLKDARSTHIKNILNWKVQGKDSDSVSSLKDCLQIKGHESLMDNADESKDFYSVFGPYEFPAYKSGVKKADKQFISDFWGQFSGASSNSLDFRKATGLYVIGVRNGSNITPLHIGTSGGYSYEQGIRRFQDQRMNSILQRNGIPVVFFLPRVSGKSDQKFQGISKSALKMKNMQWVERWLLGYGIAKNSTIETDEAVIANIIRDLHIEGFVNDKKRGKAPEPVNQLRQLLGEA